MTLLFSWRDVNMVSPLKYFRLFFCVSMSIKPETDMNKSNVPTALSSSPGPRVIIIFITPWLMTT